MPIDLRLECDDSPAAFAAQAWGWLDREPIWNNVICSLIADQMRRGTDRQPGELYLRVIDANGTLVGAAIRTPPARGTLLAMMGLDVAAYAGTSVAACVPDLPLASGPQRVVEAFAQAYVAGGTDTTAPRSARHGPTQLVYQLDAVRTPHGIPGRSVPASLRHAPLFTAWLRAFYAEAVPTEPAIDFAAAIHARLIDQPPTAWVWEVGEEPVSFAWHSPVPTGTYGQVQAYVPAAARVGAVYTPPNWRGRGFAGANVAAISRRLLRDGARACMLYTDAANPISNKVYQAIGYRLVGQAGQWLFGERR